MVRLLLVYCLGLYPLFTLIEIVVMIASDSYAAQTQADFDLFLFNVSDNFHRFAVATLLVAGGVQLWQRNQSAIWPLTIGLCCSLIGAVSSLLAALITTVVFFGVPQEFVTGEPEITDAQALGLLVGLGVLVVVGLTAMVFEIVSLVWLHRRFAQFACGDSRERTGARNE